ncbi:MULTISPECIES: porin family protein [unclassified Brevundimonas]|uniref:porin family protein n=1 Tax=unclassified Brevundimonas TaxID=2622653 RepID=UPI0025BBE110|nr:MULTISPECIES: porin family protein [unclassified Brevundimonas]
MRKIMMLAAVAAVAATPALAQSNSSPWSMDEARGYGSLGYSYLEDSYTGAVQGRMGVELNRYLALEAEVGVGVKDKDFSVLGQDGTLKHEWDAAGYVVGKVPVGENFEVFARGGYGHTEMKRELAGVSTDEGGDHWSYGAGAEFKLNEDNGIRADWTRREFKGDRDSLDAYSVNYVRRF